MNPNVGCQFENINSKKLRGAISPDIASMGLPNFSGARKISNPRLINRNRREFTGQ